jgi:hypothetical protein
VHYTFLSLLLFSRFFCELLWKQREGVVISGIIHFSDLLSPSMPPTSSNGA